MRVIKPSTLVQWAGRHSTAAHFDKGRLYLLDFLTHADYDKDTWKRRL